MQQNGVVVAFVEKTKKGRKKGTKEGLGKKDLSRVKCFRCH
jgi:hypothetical protein